MEIMRYAAQERETSDTELANHTLALGSLPDGPNTLIRPRAFRRRVACRLRLGVPVWHEGASCPCCTHTLDIFGVHGLCCTTSGDLIARHNRIRDLVDKITREGHLGPVLE